MFFSEIFVRTFSQNFFSEFFVRYFCPTFLFDSFIRHFIRNFSPKNIIIFLVYAEPKCHLTSVGGCVEYLEKKLGNILYDTNYTPDKCYEKCLKTESCGGFFIRRGTCGLVKSGCTSNRNPYYKYYDKNDCNITGRDFNFLKLRESLIEM